MTTDAARCPLCGEPNQCALAGGCNDIDACWCRGLELSQALRERVGEGCIGDACICESCLRKLAAEDDRLASGSQG